MSDGLPGLKFKYDKPVSLPDGRTGIVRTSCIVNLPPNRVEARDLPDANGLRLEREYVIKVAGQWKLERVLERDLAADFLSQVAKAARR